MADVPPTPLVEAEAERLSELRLGADELRITAELALGGHDQAVAELRRLLADHPLREGLWLLLMRALDGAGRHAEALEAYGQARDAISGQLGVDPGAELRQLHADLLAKDTAPAGVITAGVAEPPRGTRSRAASGPRRQAQRRLGPAQLPADIADFTGRDEQVKRLSDLLSGTGASGDPGAVRIAVVAGSGGLGKTSLAVHAAHRVRRRFPDGQLYVDLLGATAAPLLPGDVLARFLRDLGVDGRDIPVDEDERAARYRTTLARRRMLVVLDNARDAAQVRPLLPGSASSAVLVTTRSRMPDLASTKLVDLNVLDDDEALKLFVKVVGEERAAAEPEATAELLDACAGLPLAIRICAARLVTRSGWTIRAMAGRLTDEHRRLDEMRAGDLAVRASFEVSFTSLPPSTDKQGIDPALAFRLLGLWQGPSISAAAAAALFGVPEYSAEDALEVLVDTHLLESVATDRYRFHDLLRVYAAERAEDDLPAAERDAAVARLLAWYMRTADAAATAVSPHRYNIPLDPGGADPPPLGFADRRGGARLVRQRARQPGRRHPPGGRGRSARHRLAAARFLVQHLQPPRQLGGLHRHQPHRAGECPAGGRPPRRGVGPEQPRRCPGRDRRSRRHRLPGGIARRSGARSVTGWERRRRPTTSPTPISGWGERMRHSSCTGARWS